MTNLLLETDSYKHSHARMYPPNTSKIYSYFESRGGEYSSTIFFGLQYYILRYLTGQVITSEDIIEASQFLGCHMPGVFQAEDWIYLFSRYKGRLPVSIKAVPEGTLVPVKNVLLTIENTDPKLFWLSNFLETLLVKLWYPCTVATISGYCAGVILKFLEETGDPSLLPFKLHDFGCRGATSPESAAIGGASHLVYSKGTDTLPALKLIHDYYGVKDFVAGYSVPASEHSTMTSWGKAHEAEAYANALEKYPTGLLSIVSDSYDIFKACREIWGGKLRDSVLARDGVLVIRPDSGTPESVVLDVLSILGEKFGVAKNEKGYKVLNPKIRILQGDGVSPDKIRTILYRLKYCGWSADNIVFGMGGKLLQDCNRDTQKFAFKCSEAIVDGQPREVFKDPVTDPGKRSKKGRLKLTAGERGLTTVSESAPGEDQLVEVFRDGEVLKRYTFDEVRENTCRKFTK